LATIDQRGRNESMRNPEQLLCPSRRGRYLTDAVRIAPQKLRAVVASHRQKTASAAPDAIT
jgi:hypothetical protein